MRAKLFFPCCSRMIRHLHCILLSLSLPFHFIGWVYYSQIHDCYLFFHMLGCEAPLSVGFIRIGLWGYHGTQIQIQIFLVTLWFLGAFLGVLYGSIVSNVELTIRLWNEMMVYMMIYIYITTGDRLAGADHPGHGCRKLPLGSKRNKASTPRTRWKKLPAQILASPTRTESIFEGGRQPSSRPYLTGGGN